MRLFDVMTEEREKDGEDWKNWISVREGSFPMFAFISAPIIHHEWRRRGTSI